MKCQDAVNKDFPIPAEFTRKIVGPIFRTRIPTTEEIEHQREYSLTPLHESYNK